MKKKKRLYTKNKYIIDILKWARAVQDSIIAGEYNIPKEMIYSVNSLQDVVMNCIYQYSNYPELPEDYVKYRDEQYKLREEKLRKLCKQLRNK